MVEDWETSHLYWMCPSQVGYVYDRPVYFQVQSVCVHRLSDGGVLVLNQDTTASFSRQDNNSIGQDGKCIPTINRDPRQDGFQVGGDTVWIQSRGGLVKYQTCLKFCRSTTITGKLQTTITDSLLPTFKKYLVTDKSAPVEHPQKLFVHTVLKDIH